MPAQKNTPKSQSPKSPSKLHTPKSPSAANSPSAKVLRGQYLHFKGKKYDVIGVAKHSETLEDLVIYEALYENELSQLWARPIDSFTGTKEIDGKKVKRFKRIGPAKHARIEVHVGTICFWKGKCLILKRSPSRSLYPGLWECGGGKVRPGEDFDSAVKRQVKEEMGLKCEIIKPFGTYNIPIPDRRQKIIPGVVFAVNLTTKSKNETPPVKLSDEHTEWQLVNESEIDKFEFIPKVNADLKQAFSILDKAH